MRISRTALSYLLLDMIKVAVEQLANDQSVPQKQTVRELQNIQEYIWSAIEIIHDETTVELDD